MNRIQPNIKKRIEFIINDGKTKRLWKNRTEFSEVMGITPQILCNIMSPKVDREIPKSLIMGLARVNYNITWLLHGTGNHINTSNELTDNKGKEYVIDIIKENISLANCNEIDHVKDKMSLIRMYIDHTESFTEDERLQLYLLTESIGKLKGAYERKMELT